MMNYPGMPGMVDAPGKNFLRVTGILFIIFNIIGFFMTVSVVLTTDTWLWMFGGQAMRTTWNMLYGMSLLLSLFAVAVGIMGVALCNKIEKGGMLFATVIILMVLSVINNIVYTVVISGFDGVMGFSNVISIPISLVLPVLFMIGASRNKKAHEAAPYQHHSGYPPQGPGPYGQ